MNLPSWQDLQSRVGQFVNRAVVQPFKSADNFVQNTANTIGSAGVRTIQKNVVQPFTRTSQPQAPQQRFQTPTALDLQMNSLGRTQPQWKGSQQSVSQILDTPEVRENVMNLSGVGGTANLAVKGKLLLKEIAKSTNPQEIATYLQGHVTKDILPKLSEALSGITKPKEVQQLVDSANLLHPTPAPLLQEAGMPQFTPQTSPIAPAPSLDNFPLLSGRTPIPGLTKPQSAIQTSREIITGRGKSTMITGAPEDLVGSTATITKNGKFPQVKINTEPAGVNAPFKSTPLLPAGETPPPMLSLPNGPTRNTPMTTFGDVEKALYGHEAFTPTTGGKAGVGVIGDTMRNVESKVDGVVSNMLSSQNPLLRIVGNTLRGFAGGLGKTKEAMNRVTGFHGQSDYGTKLAEDFQRLMPTEPTAMKNLLSHLDPEITGGITRPLDAAGKEQLSIARVVSDFINDTNYKNGLVSEEQWMKNRGGRYIARAYDSYDMPSEIADFVRSTTATAKLDLNPFKKRGDLTDWKIEHSIQDPGYLLGKRLQQTIFNDSTKGMFDWLSTQGQYVSDVAKGGYSKITEHPAYGSLSGKFVRKDVMESVRGLYFEHDWLQKGYDLLKAWDNNKLRRGLKKMMTVFNPPVRAGNVFGNVSFSHFNGLNPVTFGKDFAQTPSLVNTKDPFALRCIREGVLGSGTHKGDIVKYAEELKQGVTDESILAKIDDMVSKSYGETDDRAKYVAMKMHLKNGASWEEAKFRVMSGFQNYHNIGFLYDIGSKLPFLGNPFVRFQASMMTILKNTARDHPIRAVGTALLFTYFQDIMSRVSGESKEDQATREGRVGAPHFPFTNISLTVQTPWGEVNPARMIGMYSGNPVGGNTVSNDLSRVMPIKSPFDARNWGSDPVAGPIISLGTDTNFQGKSIADPDATKFSPSTLTDTEKMGNQAKFLQRSYTPSFANSLSDVGSSLQGKEDYYGRTRTPLQSISSAAGVKVEQYGPQQAQEQRIKDQQFAQYAKTDAQKSVNSIVKEQMAGKIDQKTADARIKNVLKDFNAGGQKQNPGNGDSRIVQNPLGVGYLYTDTNGDLKKVATEEKAQRAVAKMDFAESGKSIQEWNGRVFKRNEDDSISDVSKAKYNSQLLGAQLTAMQDNEDYQGWLDTAKKQYQNFEDQLKDSSIDPQESQSIKNQMHDLLVKAARFQKYGGFTKPKSGGKGKAIKFKGDLKTFSTKATTTKAPTMKYKTLRFAPPTVDIKPYKVK